MQQVRRAVALAFGIAIVTGAPVALGGIGLDAVDDVYEIGEDAQLKTDEEAAPPGVLANDSVTIGHVPCLEIGDLSGVHGFVQLSADGKLVYEPDQDYNGAGTDNFFTYSLSEVPDGAACPGPNPDTATVRITVTPKNDPPVAAPDTFQFVWNQTLTISAPGVLANDTDVDGDSLTAVEMTDPIHGVLTLAANGGFSYTPEAGSTCPGVADSFSYRATDGTANSQVRAVVLQPAALPCPTPFVSPTPAPTPTPTPAPTPTPEPSPSASPEASPSAEPSPFDSGSPVPAASATPSPEATADPSPIDEEGGLSMPVLLVGVLLAVLLLFGAAYAVPKWIERQRGGPHDEPPYDDGGPYDEGGPYDDSGLYAAPAPDRGR